MRALALLALLLACGPADAPKAAPAPAPSDKSQSPEPPKKAEPFADPKLTPPPPPDGAALLPDRKAPIYVQKCDPAHPCPDLQQPAGTNGCINCHGTFAPTTDLDFQLTNASPGANKARLRVLALPGVSEKK